MGAGAGFMQNMNNVVRDNRNLLKIRSKQREAYRSSFEHSLKKRDLVYAEADEKTLNEIRTQLRLEFNSTQKKRVFNLLASAILTPVLIFAAIKAVVWLFSIG